MPRFNVNAPDGSVIPVDAPDGATEQDAIAFAASTWKPKAAPTDPISQIPGTVRPGVAEQPTSLLDKVRGGIEAGAALTTAIPAGVVGQVAGIGQGLFGGKYGTPEGVREAADTASRVTGAMTYRPRGQAGQGYVQNIGNALNNSGVIGVGLPELNMLGKVAAPAARAAGDVLRSEGSLIKGAVQAPLEARAARINDARVAQSWQNAPGIEAAQKANKMGIALDPAVSNPTKTNKVLATVAGTQDLETQLSKQNMPKWNSLVKKDLGLPENSVLNKDAINKALDMHGGPAEKVRAIPVIEPDAAVIQKIEDMRISKPMIGGREKAAATNQAINEALDDIKTGYSGSETLDNIRELRHNANAVLRVRDAGNAVEPAVLAKAETHLKLANALEDLIDANVKDPQIIADLKAARAKQANIYDVARSLDYATGQVDPTVLAKMVSDGKKLSGVAGDIGEIAANYPGIAKIKKGESLRMPVMIRSGIGGAAGAAIGSSLGPVGAVGGAALGAGAGSLVSKGAAKMMAKPGYQKAHAIPKDYRKNTLAPESYNNQNALSPP